MYRAIAALALLPAAVLAQSASESAAPSATSPVPSAGETHVVLVGDSGRTFSPDNVNAAVGDIVEFHFVSNGHSVAQSSFDAPCQPRDNNAFFSGRVRGEIFSVEVTSEDPIWYYCAEGNHCRGGMVGAINAPTSGNTLAAYRDASGNAGRGSSPGSVQGGELRPLDSAGIGSHGQIRWGLIGASAVMAALAGGMML
ncbi:Cupredoxin [Sodiomyces alkalinus F11]|uniref:Cupredoxin n=1 Tax=Sodiomyces alkalinus (strain CBS 110278 / VKM F-3762 / F11) TaxID=1314773 RepID=A0A3N2PPR9_SODAK|nr:Cupredoxin [Sodiomyces alkalinus F11]ROT36444.1 Cupredoxin [Sodiomyces alkalinus F11]